MKKVIQNSKISALWKSLKPWLSIIAILLILRYTGALSAISVLTNRTVLETGLMDATASAPANAEYLNYDFVIKDLEGNTIDFKTYKGKTIFINLWATWCGPCRAEMPSIQKLYDQVDKSKITFIMLSLDVPEHSKKVTDYLNSKGFTFPGYMGSNLPSPLDVNSIPTTFIVGKDGKIEFKKVGVANYDNPKFQNFLEEIAAK